MDGLYWETSPEGGTSRSPWGTDWARVYVEGRATCSKGAKSDRLEREIIPTDIRMAAMQSYQYVARSVLWNRHLSSTFRTLRSLFKNLSAASFIRPIFRTNMRRSICKKLCRHAPQDVTDDCSPTASGQCNHSRMLASL